MKLYLASKSPRRREILDLMRLDYDIVTAEADESLPVGIGMEAAGTLLAERKAKAAAGTKVAPSDIINNFLSIFQSNYF